MNADALARQIGKHVFICGVVTDGDQTGFGIQAGFEA